MTQLTSPQDEETAHYLREIRELFHELEWASTLGHPVEQQARDAALILLLENGMPHADASELVGTMAQYIHMGRVTDAVVSGIVATEADWTTYRVLCALLQGEVPPKDSTTWIKPYSQTIAGRLKRWTAWLR